MIAKNTKQTFDDLVFQKYCNSTMIPIELRKEYRRQIEASSGYQRFVLARALEMLWIAIEYEFKKSILGRWLLK